jgi:putative SOS response-associated peptidase YedK
MCGRFTLRRDNERVRHDLLVQSGSASVIFKPRYNVAPTDQVPLLHLGEHGKPELSQMVWGIATLARDNRKRLTRHITLASRT